MSFQAKATFLFASLAGQKAIKFALVIAPLFTVVAVAQVLFVRVETRRAVLAEQTTWAEEIIAQIAYKTNWDLGGYRNASTTVPSWYVVSSDGLIIDIEGFLPGLFPKAKLLDTSILDTAKTVHTETGEKWRLLGKQVEGGMVVVGQPIVGTETTLGILDGRLKNNADRFGASLKQASAIESRTVDSDLDYVVLDDAGAIIFAWGGIPLRLTDSFRPPIGQASELVKADGKFFMVYAAPILDSMNSRVGTVFIPKDVSYVETAGRIQARFNVCVIAVMWILVALMSVPFFHGLIRRQQRISLLKEKLQDAALEEDHMIEFKPAYQWDSRTNQQNKELRLDFFLKPVAAFLNAEGGTLFLGVQDDGQVCGFEPDLRLVNESVDRIRLEMLQLIGAKIGNGFGRSVQVQLAEIGKASPRKVCIVDILPSQKPAFVKWNNNECAFYVRSGNQSVVLNPQAAVEYLRANRN